MPVPSFVTDIQYDKCYTASEKVWASPNLFTRVYTRLEVVWSPKPLRCRYNCALNVQIWVVVRVNVSHLKWKSCLFHYYSVIQNYIHQHAGAATFDTYRIPYCHISFLFQGAHNTALTFGGL